jgi:hypothetical protein
MLNTVNIQCHLTILNVTQCYLTLLNVIIRFYLT